MDNELTSLSRHLAKNIEDLRTKRGLSQTQLAELAGLPRSTLTYLESGSGNPSLANLLKLSRTLQISLEELISEPRDPVKVFKKQDLKKHRRGDVEIHKLLPEPVVGMEIDYMNLKPQGRMKGTPHLNRTKEYLYCQQGQIELHMSGKIYILEEGDVVAFPGDRPHAYINSSKRKKATGFSVVVLT